MIPEKNILPSYFVMPILKRSSTPVSYEGDIIAEVCRNYDTTLEELRSTTRQKDIVFARHLCMFLLHRKLPKISYKRIAHIFGRVDHSTTIHAINAIENYIQTNSFNKRGEILTILSTMTVNEPLKRA